MDTQVVSNVKVDRGTKKMGTFARKPLAKKCRLRNQSLLIEFNFIHLIDSFLDVPPEKYVFI